MLAQTFQAILSSQSTRDFALCPVMPSRSRSRDIDGSKGKGGAGGSDSTGSKGKGSKAFRFLATAAATPVSKATAAATAVVQTAPVSTATAAAMGDWFDHSDSYGSTSKGSKADGYGGSDSYGSKGSRQRDLQLWQVYLQVKALRPDVEVVAERLQNLEDELEGMLWGRRA